MPRPVRMPSASSISGTNDLTKLITAENWVLALTHVQSSPRQAQSWSARPGFFEGIKESDVLPIHQACNLRSCPPDMISALIVAYPEGLRKRESAYRRLPVHIACRSGARLDVIQTLLSHYKDGANMDDSLGRLPLHYAISNGASPEVVDALLDAAPNGARAYDRRGWLPIHVAASVGASPYVIERLLKQYPQSVALGTDKGSTPLNLCLEVSTSPTKPQVVELLQKTKEKVDAEHKGRQPKRPSSSSFVLV